MAEDVRTCSECGADFAPRDRRHRACSPECSRARRRRLDSEARRGSLVRLPPRGSAALDRSLDAAPWIAPTDALAKAMLEAELAKYSTLNREAQRLHAAGDRKGRDRTLRAAAAALRAVSVLMRELGLTPRARGEVLRDARDGEPDALDALRAGL